MHRYTAKQNQDVLDAVKSGMSGKEAADYAGVPINRVYRWAEKAKLEFKTHSLDHAPRLSDFRHSPDSTNERLPVDISGVSAHVINTITDNKYFENKPQPSQIGALEVGQLVAAYLREHPIKITTEDFMEMLHQLYSENTQTKEELARLRKSLGEWQKRAGQIMEQAQELASKQK
jgi:hypothetical protein